MLSRDVARLAAHQGRESYSHDGVRAAARPFVPGGGMGDGGVPHVSGGGLRGRYLCAKDTFPLPYSGNYPLREQREYPPGFSVSKRYSSARNPGNLFGKTKRKWGFNPVRHRRTSSHQSGAFDVSKENVGCILRGKAALPAANRRLFYGSSRISGILMHRGPPRPRLSSALGMAWMRMPASSKERLVT